jgi:hypothetical protein
VTGKISSLLGADGLRWDLPEEEGARQAIGALRGYAYQLHQSLAAWIDLPEGGALYLEAAEDYATLAVDPRSLETVLTATQVKDTRESGSVTLNSPNILDAIGRLWSLQNANPGRAVRLTFLTTSPIGHERRNPLPSGQAALEAWRHAARGGDVAEIRQALKDRLTDPDIAAFLTEAGDNDLRQRLLRPLRWACGEPPIAAIEADNRAAIIELGHTLGGTPELSARAVASLLDKVLTTVVASADRRLTRGDLIEIVSAAVTISMPAQTAMAVMAQALTGPPPQPALDLSATGAWRELLGRGRTAARNGVVATLLPPLGETGCLWIHGATGLGKSTLGELVARAHGGVWRTLDLREAPAAAAVERIGGARNAITALPGLQGVVIDDLTVEQERELEAPLAQLQSALERRDAVLIVTSRNPPGQRLMRAVGAAAGSVHPAPSFDEDDAAALVAAYGGDPATWARFAWIAGGVGHPQLIDVVVSGLAARDWPSDEMQRWIAAGLKSDDVEAERDASRRRLLAELTPEILQFLYRATHIVGAFDRELALVVGRADPALADCAGSLDRLSGHWIERVSSRRLRASPLIAGLDRQMLSDNERAALDRAIALSILQRKTAEPDLVDTAFAHALLGQAADLLMAIVQLVLDADGPARGPIASGMVMFRIASIPETGFLSEWPYVVLMLRLAQHRLIAAIGDDDAFRSSADRLVGLLDRLPDPDVSHAGGMVLSMLLLDEFAFGRLPDWFALLQRFDAIAQDDPEFTGLTARVAEAADYDPIDFMFLAHAIHMPDLAALVRLFDDLDRLSEAHRQRWLSALYAHPSWLNLLIDNAWLKQSLLAPLDGRSQADVFRRLGDLAAGWGEPRLAARCFQAEAVMLDEYAKDAIAALAALDRADALLPDNVVLKRARAKIAFRAKDYAAAHAQMMAIIDRLDDADPLDGAFAIRQTGVSAGELGRWAEAASLFERARVSALKATEGRLTPLNVGLGADAAAARFASGDHIGAVREMRAVLQDVDQIPTDGDRKAHYCHLVSRHVVHWMRSCIETEMEPPDEPPIYPAGCVSNPDPPSAIDDRPISAMVTTWSTLARLGLQIGIDVDEVLSWPGVADVRNYAALDMVLRTEILRTAIRDGSLSEFKRFVMDAIAAAVAFSGGDLGGDRLNVMTPTRAVVANLGPQALTADPPLGLLRDATLAMACRLVLPDAEGAIDLGLLHDIATELAGIDPLPEWGGGGAPETGDLRSVVAGVLWSLASSEPATVEGLYRDHLRLAEWVAACAYKPILTPLLADRVRRDWEQVLESRGAFLVSPLRTTPAIRAALDAKGLDEAFIAGVLLAVEPAVRANLSEEYRATLRARLIE